MAELMKQGAGGVGEAAEQTRDVPTYTPRFDIWEGADELILWGDMPGVRPEDVDIQFENRELTIRGKVAPRQPGVEYLAAEYGVGDFLRTFRIGETIEGAKIRAEFSNGVLTLHLPKTEKVKPRRIQVQIG
jgi:HSP20 family protein